MIDYIHKNLYWQDSIDKQLKIELEDGTILDNSMIYSEEFELAESLCSEDELRFGACEASCVKFRIFSIPNRLVGQKITISEVLGGQTDSPMQIGKYKIASAKPTADRDFIDIVAYDSMYNIIHANVAAWYNNQFKATTSTTTDEDGNETTVVTYSTTTLKKFRDSFFSHFGIEQVDVTLPNDNMVVSKTIEIVPNEDGTIGETLSGSVVIEAICELNGCFGHINRDGKFEYVNLQLISKELFPSDDLFPRNDLYPASDNTGVVIYNWQYEATEYEDFDVQPITQVQIIQEDNDIGMTVGADGNKYVVNSNFLTYSLSDAELETVGTNLLSVIEKSKYTPIKANVIGNPCVTVGDIIKIVTNSAILYSYVINRTLKGCQSLTDEFESNGEEYRSVDVNSTIGQIKKLQGRSNVLERSIDETRSTITNVEKGLKSEIKQTAESITSEVERATSEEQKLSSKIEQTAESITSEVERATSEEQKLSSKIEQTAESITSTVAESTKQWDTVDSNGNAVSIKQSGYGFDGSISGGDSYVYSDSMNEDDIYLDQKLGYGWACKGTKVINGRRAALFGYRPRYVFHLITSNLSSEIEQTSSQIVLKVDANGRIVEVALTGDPKDGTEFTVDADNISLTASDIIDIIAGNSINLTSKHISMDSTNFSVDEDGNMSCKKAQIEGDVVATSAIIYDSLTMRHSTATTEGYDQLEKVLEYRYIKESDPAENAVVAKIRFISTNLNVWGSLGVSGRLDVSGDAVISGTYLICQQFTANQGATILGALTAGSISSNGACGFGSVWTGALTCAGDTVVPDWYANTTANGSNCHIGSAGRIRRVASSSKRYKDDITTDIKEELDPHKLYDTTIYQYKYKEGYLSSEKGKRKDRIGFIVEDLEKQYPIAVDYIKDEKGKEIPENWNDRYLIPPMLKLIQEQKQEIDTLKQQLATLTERMDRYEQGL